MYVTITKRLREAGFRATPQRVAIYMILAQTKAHPCAERVYEKLHSEFPSLSLNTVYKTLQTFEELGLVRRLDTGEGICRYDANPAPHIHLACRACGQVVDIDYDGKYILERMSQYVKENGGHEVCDFNLILYGYCRACSNGEASSN
ncbi:MAG: transcriptional repressor [Firmicutes bacterium]|nr:transcriptional repressor [Bacillota bacterium]